MSCFGSRRELLLPGAIIAAMVGAIDCARSAVEAMVETGAVTAVEAAVIGGAHPVRLAADGSFAALELDCLAGVDAACLDAVANALLLVVAALADGCGVALRQSRRGRGRGSLSKANG